jgi:glycosyltransferase involved in cell wall biosynthesis
MYFGLPVLAYDCTAIPYTLGGRGVLFTHKDYPVLAETLERLVGDASLRERIVAGQRERLQDFSEERTAHTLADYLFPLLDREILL